MNEQIWVNISNIILAQFANQLNVLKLLILIKSDKFINNVGNVGILLN